MQPVVALALLEDQNGKPGMNASQARRDTFLWAVVCEGAVDRFLGRPRGQNPYCPGEDSTEAWLYGWDEGDWLIEIRGQDEVRRWLQAA